MKLPLPDSMFAPPTCGSSEHIALQFLKAWGCRVTAFTSSDDKKKEALALGSHKVLNTYNPTELGAARNQFDLGLVPKQHSSGGKQLLLGISKRGDTYAPC